MTCVFFKPDPQKVNRKLPDKRSGRRPGFSV